MARCHTAVCIFLLSLAAAPSEANIEFTCAEDSSCAVHCINELVEYNCSILVDYDVEVTIVWRIFNSDGINLGQVSHTLGNDNRPSEIAPGFNLGLLNLSDSKSSISFTAEANQDGYTIECGCMYWYKYKKERQSKMCTINIEDIPIINVMEPSYTSTSVQISWTTTANCITNYIINSTTSDDPTTTTSDTSYTLPVSSLGEGVHYFSVAGVDTGGRTGPYSNTVSVTISVPPTVNFTYRLYDGEGDTVVVVLSWTVDEVCPPISSYYITSGDTTISVPSSTTMYTIDGVSNGTNVTVFAENAIGNGTKEYKTILLPLDPSTPSTTSVSSGVQPMAGLVPGLMLAMLLFS